MMCSFLIIYPPPHHQLFTSPNHFRGQGQGCGCVFLPRQHSKIETPTTLKSSPSVTMTQVVAHLGAALARVDSAGRGHDRPQLAHRMLSTWRGARRGRAQLEDRGSVLAPPVLRHLEPLVQLLLRRCDSLACSLVTSFSSVTSATSAAFFSRCASILPRCRRALFQQPARRPSPTGGSISPSSVL